MAQQTGKPSAEEQRERIEKMYESAKKESGGISGMKQINWQEAKVAKGTGHIEEFNPEKIKESVKKAGADERLASDVAEDIKRTTHTGMTTAEIDHDVQYVLKRRDMDTYKSWMQWKEEHHKMP